MTEPYIDGHYWLDFCRAWDMRIYGGEPHGKGDLGFNTCDQIIRDKDRSPWAHDATFACQDLLFCGARWPRSMNQDIDAKSRLRWRWSAAWKRIVRDKKGHLNKFGRWCEKIGLPIYVKYRFRGRLTRDPYTAFYAACLDLGHPELIPDTPPVWYVYNPAFWSWYRYLCTKEEKYLKRYLFWNGFSTSNKDYVVRLRELRSMAIKELNK